MEPHRPNKGGAMEAPAAEDRLTGLPDDLLHSILRGLPLKHAARTSALSRPWARKWLSALATSPVVDFADPDFARRQPPAQAAATVNRCLWFHAMHVTKLDVFRVAFPYPFGIFRPDLVGWVVLAVERGARELEVDLTPAAQVDGAQLEDDQGTAAILVLPGHLFLTKNSLQRLALGRCSLRDVPPNVAGLAGLRSLSLSHTDVTDDAVRDVVTNCRELEFLSLRSCHLLTSVQVAGNKLRVLELVRCPAVRELHVAAPALESFALHGDIISLTTSEEFEVGDEDEDEDEDDRVAVLFGATPALRNAYVSHLGIATFIDDRHEFDYYTMLNCVAHAAILTLCSVGLKNMEWSYNFEYIMDMPKLQELQLLMASLGDDDVQSIVVFFSFAKSPILDRLFIHLPGGKPAGVSGMAAWVAGEDQHDDTDDDIVLDHVAILQLPAGEPAGNSGTAPGVAGEHQVDDADDVASDLDIDLDHLTFVKVVNFRGTGSELRLLKFLMDQAPALKQLVLVTVEEEGAPGDEQLKDIQRRLSAMRRMSPEARIAVCRPSEDGSRNPEHTRLYHKKY